MNATLSPADLRDRAHQDREEMLTDRLRSCDWHEHPHYPIGCTASFRCGCEAVYTAEGWKWNDKKRCPEHNPRGPIDVHYDHGHWIATRRDCYDGAHDSGISGCIGTSQRTRAEAIRELLDCEDAHQEMRAARRAA